MVAKILDFKLSESLKMHSPGPFALSLSLSQITPGKLKFALSSRELS